MRIRYFLSAVTLGLGLTVVLLLLLTHPIPVAHATPGIYYVREGASGNCLSVTTPCSSVQHAINLATIPDDEVWVAGGTYTENLVITHSVKLRGGWDVSFTVQSPVSTPAIIDGGGDHVVRIDAAGEAVELDGLTLTNGRDGIHIDDGVVTTTRCTVQTYARQGIEIDDGTVWLAENLIRDGEREGVEIDGGTVTVLSNTVDGVGRYGILVEGGDVIIKGNLIHDVRGEAYHGIRIEVNGVIVGNEIADVGDRGIDALNGTFLIANNIVRNAGGDGIRTADTSTEVEIRDNIIYNTGNDGIDARGVTITIAANTVAGCADNGIKAEGVGNWAHIEANWVLSNAVGIAIHDAPVFTLTNNVIGDNITSSVELTGTATGFLYHNTLVGSGTGAQGIGLTVLSSLTATIVNSIVVSHHVGITATPGATLIVSNTLLWGNGDDPISGTDAVLLPPRFVAPSQRDYHLLPGSPAVDAGIDIGVADDVDGDPRLGTPDIGADEVWYKVHLPITLRSAPTL